MTDTTHPQDDANASAAELLRRAKADREKQDAKNKARNKRAGG